MEKKLTIGYTANIKEPQHKYDESYDEWETPENVENVVKALEFTGNEVIVINADKDIFYKLDKYKDEIDIVFNNAEGLPEVESRESTTPVLLELLVIPYTGSNPQALANALDKVTTREILANYGINNLPFQRFQNYADRLKKGLSYPLIVKPAMEGTSIGLSQDSIVENGKELYEAVRYMINLYGKPVIAEEFVDGREFTVGIIGNLVLPPLYFDLHKIPGNPKVRDGDVKYIDVTYSKVLTEYDKIYRELVSQAVIAHIAMGCDDYNRIDFREKDGKIYFLEINPLPGLHPTKSDLPEEARSAGINYNTLINMMLYEAIRRHREDTRYPEIYAGRFSDSKIENIVSLVGSKREELKAYGRIQKHDIIAKL